ncbi:hypothetical protein LTR17_017285 [Elasticomyces elasticus]|nr:hypothetical protein LTR17_017285 [Elasticomyces elasticus]
MYERLSFSTTTVIDIHPEEKSIMPSRSHFWTVKNPQDDITFDLMRLPSEVRLIIYAYAMPNDEYISPIRSIQRTQQPPQLQHFHDNVLRALRYLYAITVPKQLRSLAMTLSDVQVHASELLVRMDKSFSAAGADSSFTNTVAMTMPALLQTSHVVRTEALPVYFASNTFVLDVQSSYKAYCESLAWLRAMDPHGLAGMVRIVIVGQILCLGVKNARFEQDDDGLPFAIVARFAAAQDAVHVHRWVGTDSHHSPSLRRLEKAVIVVQQHIRH